MEGLGLLLGHLIGDYILQDDWQAANKTSPAPIGHVACTLHCTLYTLAVWLCSFWWMPWWGLAICWLAHFPVDRWRLARVLMRWTNHEAFATGPLSPWSIILTDNIVHLAVLFGIGVARI
jgi:hypothetical protein